MAGAAPRIPPSRDGVGPSCVGLPSGPWPTITDFLCARFPAVPRPTWLARMADGSVVDEHGQPVTPERPHQSPLRVYYYRSLAHEPALPFDEAVLHQDDHLLVADKPHFMPVTPGGRYVQQTLLVRLKRRLGLEHLVPLHRIDRETAGLVLFSLNPASRSAYAALVRAQGLTKTYEAIAPLGDLTLPLTRESRLAEDERFFRQREVPGTPNARTHVALVRAGRRHGLYRLTPVSGRQHQLRVHMAALGMPLLGDQFYPVVRQPAGADDDITQPLQLLARGLAFTDPLSGAPRRFESRRQLQLDRLDA